MKRKNSCTRKILLELMVLSLIGVMLSPFITVEAVADTASFSPTVDSILSNWVSEQDSQVLSVKDKMSAGYTDKYWATGGCYAENNVLDSAQASVHLKRYGFFKYDLSLVDRPIKSASFVFSYRDNNSTAMTLNFKEISGEWDSSLYWLNRPQMTGTFTQANLQCTATGGWITAATVDMTDFVNRCLAQEDKEVNFAIDNISWAGTLDIASSENTTASYRPQLVIDYGYSNDLYPTEDTFVSNWITEQDVIAKGFAVELLAGDTYLTGQTANSLDGTSKLTRYTLFKYDISDLTEGAISAKFYISYNVRTPVGNPANVTYREVGNGWSETGTNFSNKPSLGDVIATRTFDFTDGDIVTDAVGVDITDYLNQCRANGNTMSIAVANSTGGNHMKIFSREIGLLNKNLMPYITIATTNEQILPEPEFVYNDLYDTPPITPVSGHPRLFVTENGLDELGERFYSQDAALQQIQTKVRNYAASTTQNFLYAVSNAILYLVGEGDTYGQKAVDYVWNALNVELEYGQLTSYYDIAPNTLYTASLVYDWCYDLIPQNEKELYIELIKKMAVLSEHGYPPVAGSNVVGHMPAPIMCNLLAAGIAVYDEEPEIYNLAAGRMFQEIIPARNWFYQSGGLHYQGLGTYGLIRMQSEIFPNYLFGAMGYNNIFTDRQGDSYYQTIYARTPNGRILKSDDNGEFNDDYSFLNQWEKSSSQDSLGVMLMGINQNPYYRDEWVREYNTTGYYDATKIFRLFYNDFDVKPKSVTSLPLTRYFGKPLGFMVARTGWDEAINVNSDTVVATMNLSEYNPGNHKHLDVGNFQIYYRGNLAVDSGVYYDYNSSHHNNYYKRSIANNCMLVYDPNELFSGYVNDGGQRIIGEAKDLDSVMNDPDHKTGEIIYADYGPDVIKPDYSYLKGNIVGAYSSKVEEYERSFLFVNTKDATYPAFLTVFDRVISSDPSFKKTWLLHTVDEPVIEGNKITITKTGSYTGKMVNTALLPESKSITKIEGYDVNGTSYPYNTLIGEDHWRAEICPTTNSKEHLFLNVMQIEGNNVTPLTTTKIETIDLVGAAIKDYVLLFSKTGQELQNNQNGYTVSYANTTDDITYIVADMKSGVWEIDNNSVISNKKVEDNKGILYIEGKGGSISLTYLGLEDASIVEYNDIDGHEMQVEIENLQKYGVLENEGSAFYPNNYMKIIDLLNWVMDLLSINKGENIVNTAYGMGWLDEDEMPKANFNGDLVVTRELFAQVAAKAFNSVTAHFPIVKEPLNTISDISSVEPEYQWSVAASLRTGIMTTDDDSKFNSESSVTRAQAAQILVNLKNVTENYLYNKLDANLTPWIQKTEVARFDFNATSITENETYKVTAVINNKSVSQSNVILVLALFEDNGNVKHLIDCKMKKFYLTPNSNNNILENSISLENVEDNYVLKAFLMGGDGYLEPLYESNSIQSE